MRDMPTLPGETGGPALTDRAYRRLVWLMAVTAGAVVANNYYNQPLLADIAVDFGTSERSAALIATLTQVGYAMGLLFLLPLGDMLERRKILTVLLLASCAMLVAFASAPHFPLLVLVAFLLGFSSTVPQFLPPIAARLAPPGHSGRSVGFVMGGLLLGIILSRFVGGIFGGAFGWRAVYWTSAVLMIVLLVLLRRSLPVMQPTFTGSYGKLLGSLADLFLRYGRLRLLASVAALQFGAFALFWTTIVFHFERELRHDASTAVGLLALIGAVGVLAAPMAGRLADRLGTTTIISASGALMALAFLIMGITGGNVLWIIPAVVLLDLGMQVGHVSSMSEVLQLEPAASSRLNTIYMVLRFCGAALGTFLGAQTWHYFGWQGVTILGVVMTTTALVIAGMSRIAPGAAADHD